MKKICLAVLTTISCLGLKAQQESVFTQYVTNMQGINPAYVGSRGTLTANLLHRSQWTGIDDAPRTQTFTLNSPVYNENFGVGFAILNDRIGPINTTLMNVDLAGRIKVNEGGGYLSAGIKLGLNFFRANITGLNINDPDPNFTQNVSSTLPNVGVGMYYHTPKFYLGVSAPRLIDNLLARGEQVAGQARERRHFYLATGTIFNLNADWKIQPAFLFYVPERAPTTFNLSSQFIFQDRIWLGAGWRWDESVNALVGYNFNKTIRMMYSYDFLIGELRPFSGGSHEISLLYDLPLKSQRIQNPRYF